MQPFKKLTLEMLFDQDFVREDYIFPLKTVIESNCKSFKMKVYYEYSDGAEGIRYEFDSGFVDWIKGGKNKPEQIRIPYLFLRIRLLDLLRGTHFD
jgi:hypothetical protein